MDDVVAERLEILRSLRKDGEPLVFEGEDPIHKLADAIHMAERGGLLYRYAMDGRTFQYRVTEQSPVLMCHMTEAPIILCNLAQSEFQEAEWIPTPEYQKLLDEKPKPKPKAKPKPKPEPEEVIEELIDEEPGEPVPPE